MPEPEDGVVTPTSPPANGPSSLDKFREAIVKFTQREDGPTAVEYAVVLALIIVVCLAAITTLERDANSLRLTDPTKDPPPPESAPEPAPEPAAAPQ